MQLCAKFDGVSGAATGTASTMYLAGNDITLFGYAVAQAGRDWHLRPLAMYSAGTSGNKKTARELANAKSHAIGCFVYNAGHVWYVKKTEDGKWARIDSLSGVSAISLESVWRDGMGVEVVYPSASVLDSDDLDDQQTRSFPIALLPPVQLRQIPIVSPSPPRQTKSYPIASVPVQLRPVPIVSPSSSRQTTPVPFVQTQVLQPPPVPSVQPLQQTRRVSSLLANRGTRLPVSVPQTPAQRFTMQRGALGFSNSINKRF
jgi:hypothetical protein